MAGFSPLPLLLAVALLAVSQPGCGAGPGSSTWTGHTEATSPTLDASTTVVVEVERFDPGGGSRQLRSAEIHYALLADIRLDVQANDLDVYAIAETSLRYSWVAHDALGRRLPATLTLHTFDSFVGYEAQPHEAAGSHVIEAFGVTASETVTDATTLDLLTGEGPVALEGRFGVTAAPQEPPGIEGRGVWVPDLYDLTVERVWVDLTITYHFE